MQIPSPLIWRTCLIILTIFLLAETGLVWMSGEKETADAFASGRRLLIKLDSGEITGNLISADALASGTSSVSGTTSPISEPIATPPAEVTEEKTEEKTQAAAEPTAPTPVATTEAPPADTAQEQAPIVDQAEIINTLTEIPEKPIDLPPLANSAAPPAAFSTNLLEKGDFGAIPKIGADGSKPWKYYSKKADIKAGKPMIAIIVTGLGANKNINDLALRLPEAINLSFSPYTRDLNDLAESVRISGHELLLDLPMESSNYPARDPGPLGLLVSQDQQGNETRIKKLMSHNFSYIGFVSPQDEVFLSNNELFKSLLQIFSGRGLALVVGKPPPKNETKEMVEKGNTASVIADTLIDEELTPIAISARLSLLEQTAKQHGYAVGIAQGYPITIKQIGDWAAKAEENGFVLVPVSAIISKHFS